MCAQQFTNVAIQISAYKKKGVSFFLKKKNLAALAIVTFAHEEKKTYLNMNRARLSKPGKTFNLNYCTVFQHGNVIFFLVSTPETGKKKISFRTQNSFSLTFRRMFKIVGEA